MALIGNLVRRARVGDLEAFGLLVRATQAMAHGVASSVLRDPDLAKDAVQDAYLRAFRRLGDLEDPALFSGWLRRIVVTVAINLRRSRRRTFLQLDESDVPILDDTEARWSDAQRHTLAAALLTLTPDERRLCDRRYHGRWSTARLASDAGVDETAMRKRLQRIRDKLRKEIEVTEQRTNRAGDAPSDLPARIIELLARPRLTDLPENPVGRVLEQLRSVFADHDELTLPEIVDFAEARKTIGGEALYLDASELHRVDAHRILRYDLTLPLLLTVRYEGQPLRLWASGKAYRLCQVDSTHLEAFHQAEVFCLIDRHEFDRWNMTTRVLQSIDVLLPGRAVKILPTSYPMCAQAWDLEVEDDGQWSEVLAWGVFTDKIVQHVGGDPARHIALGVGYGLERVAMLRHGIDDIRKIDVTSAA
jgi:RNA polymerase sigma-70 factor (ECF subfamily)